MYVYVYVLFSCERDGFNVIGRYDICQVLFTAACHRSIVGVFVDVAAYERSKSIAKPNFVDVSQYTDET